MTNMVTVAEPGGRRPEIAATRAPQSCASMARAASEFLTKFSETRERSLRCVLKELAFDSG